MQTTMRPARYLLAAGIFFAMALLIVLMTGCSDKDDDEEIFRGDEDTAITQPAAKTPTKTAAYPAIAGHGILWKPVSDSDGRLAVLLNPSLGRPTVKIKNSRNQVVAVGRFVYYSNPNRATYRFGSQGRAYSGGYLIVGTKIYAIGDGGARKNP